MCKVQKKSGSGRKYLLSMMLILLIFRSTGFIILYVIMLYVKQDWFSSDKFWFSIFVFCPSFDWMIKNSGKGSSLYSCSSRHYVKENLISFSVLRFYAILAFSLSFNCLWFRYAERWSSLFTSLTECRFSYELWTIL